jgi:eukaryotic-like serine/threonine-protein kinase
MTPARLQTIEEIFHAALDQEPHQISAFLDTACGGDELVRRKVEALLASHQRPGSFIETSAVGLATRIIENGQADLLVGQTFGHYKISKRIGAGGMGEVYLATDIKAGRKAALKLLPMRFTGDAERLKRFQQEAHAVVALNHPNILTVYEIGEGHSTHYIASELIEGETLRQRLMRGRIEVGDAVDVAIQVASALAAAHAAGIIHRDISPGNIMLRPDGYVKVLDFGIAKLAEQEAPATMPKDEALLLVETNLGSILGTVSYISPEQACGVPVDKRTDIWSLGVVLYEMVTGHAPFTGETPREVMTSILDKEPPPLTSYIRRIPAELRQIIGKALRKDRTERYQSAGEMLQALKNLRHKLELKAVPSWLRWTRSPAALALVLLVAALAVALPFYWQRNLTMTSRPEKSIAVLPFENLSKDEENAFFAGGVQDEILTNLAKVADLKVISRTSVMKYKSGLERNLREIAKALGVSHVVEGSVQRAGGKVRVNAQLVDTRTDKHLWGQTYDRDLADIFAIQSEIAQKIADQLEAKISPREKATITEQPTKDLAAYDLYVRATALSDRAAYTLNAQEQAKDDLQVVDLLNQAVARDPAFLLAYCRLAEAHDDVYLDNVDHTPNRLALARAAIDAAFRLKPDSGEAHLALAVHFYHGYWDYDRARDELAIAVRTLPNNARLFECSGLIDRRQNRWHDSVRNLERAMELDPRNVRILAGAAINYWLMRDYAQALAIVDRIIALEPKNIGYRFWRAQIEAHEHANIRPLQAVLEKVFDDPALLRTNASDCFLVALWARNPVAADRALAAITDKHFPARQTPVDFTRTYAKGLVARMKGDEDAHAPPSARRAQNRKKLSAHSPMISRRAVLFAS